MLVYVFACVLLLAPVLQAAFDLPLQLAFQQAVTLACLAWSALSCSAAQKGLFAFGRKHWALWAAAALSLLALLASPYKGYVFNEWGNYAAGLLIFAAASFLNKEERFKTDRALLSGAWLVFSMALIQFFILNNFMQRPPLTNLNALALYALMVVPLALERKAWPLAAAMGALVMLCQSAGAALAGLAALGFYAWSRRSGGSSGAGDKWLFFGMAVLAAAAVYFMQAASITGRLAWWRSAWEMFAARPATGFGHAAFTWAQAGFQAPGALIEHSTYAHNYYLEYMAENGLPAAAVWFWFLAGVVRSRKGLVKYSVLAALLHSAVDFGLSVPANFWLFCYLAATPLEAVTPEPEQSGSVRARLPVKAVFATLLLLEASLLTLNLKSLAFERARQRALTAAAQRGGAAALEELRPYLASRLFRVPALEFLGLLTFSGPADADRGLSSAVYYEMALIENPYSVRAWSALERLYGAAGRENSARELAARKAGVYK